MGYKNTADMLNDFKRFAGYFKEAKGEFPVHADYLIDGMTENEFNHGYDEYRKLMLNLQNDMCDKPGEYGLFTYDAKNNPKPAYHICYPYLWLFLALSFAGEVKNDVLHVSKEKFNEFVKGKAVGSHTGVPKNIGMLLNKLADFGITVDDYTNDEAEIFTISAKTPRLMTVIKASTLSQYARKSMMSDYVTFSEKLYGIGMKEQIRIEETYTYRIMPAERQEFASLLVAELAKSGWKSYIERHHNPDGGRLTYPTLEYYYNANTDVWDREHGGTWIFIRLDNVFQHLDYVENIPGKYRTIWENAMKCRGCRKGECPRRYVGKLFGVSRAWCNSAKPTYHCRIEDIPHIVEVARVMAKAK
jgi:hypothetical protein